MKKYKIAIGLRAKNSMTRIKEVVPKVSGNALLFDL
jgi:hypothetical protein